MSIISADNPTLSSHPAPQRPILVFGHFIWELYVLAALPAGILGILPSRLEALCKSLAHELKHRHFNLIPSHPTLHLHHAMPSERAVPEPGDAKGTGTWNISTQGGA